MASVRLTQADLEKHPHLAKRINASLLETERDELPRGEHRLAAKYKPLEPRKNKEEATQLVRPKLSTLIVVACLALGLFATAAYANVGLDSSMVDLIRSLIREEVSTNRAVTNPGSPTATYQPPQSSVPDPQIANLSSLVKQYRLEMEKAQDRAVKAEIEASRMKQRMDGLGKPSLGIRWKNEQGWIYITSTANDTSTWNAGIYGGTYLTHINGEVIKPDTYQTVLWQYVPNEIVTLTYIDRSGHTKTAEVRLDRNPNY